MEFVRFIGDRVSQVKIAALGKAIEIHDQDEMAGYLPPQATVAVGDVPVAEGKEVPPSLKLPNEDKTPTAVEAGVPGMRKVQMPEPKKPANDGPVDITPPPPPKE